MLKLYITDYLANLCMCTCTHIHTHKISIPLYIGKHFLAHAFSLSPSQLKILSIFLKADNINLSAKLNSIFNFF